MANGLFNLKQVMQAVQQGGWPAQKTPAVEYLVVAGGGGGGEGAGGAGGLLAGIDPVSNGQTLLVTVGGGGSYPASGSNSVFGNIASTGGGRGGVETTGVPDGTGFPGGSGGGGAYGASLNSIGGQGTFGQGNAGGGNFPGSPYPSGGGGGAGSVGSKAITLLAGNGGAGIASAISGTVTAYAGGGGGGLYASGNVGTGGVGGGGNGGSASPGTSGTANRGGGGGGGNGASSGGSGIVIVSYPDVYAAPTTTTGSPTVSTSGSGSMYTNGGAASSGGPYLSYPNSSAMQFGSGNFTIEAWCYFTVVQESTIAARYPFDSTNNEWNFGTNSSLAPLFSYSATGGNTGTGSVTSPSALSINTWYHIAVVRNSTVLTMYVNGTSVGTSTIAGSIYSGTTTSTVGCYAQSAYPNGYAVPNGYLSNVRVVKGTAVYTSNFTPSTTPLTAISGTSLLLNTVSGSYTTDSSTNSFTPSAPGAFGKPSWNQLSPFTGTGYKNRVYTWTTSGTITF
jgi:hypothetical protein